MPRWPDERTGALDRRQCAPWFESPLKVAATVACNLGAIESFLMEAFASEAPSEVFASTSSADANGAEILVTMGAETHLVAGILERLPTIEWIHVLAAGIEGLDLAAVGERTVTCSRGASATPIAEYVMAVMLDAEKHLGSIFVTEPQEQSLGSDLGTLEGKTLGLIGLGSIGTALARRALAFDMHVAAVRRRPTNEAPEGVSIVTDMGELAALSDYLVVVAPATPATYHLVNSSVLARAKPGCHLINVARGTLVDQEALVDAIDAGIVGRATLDVTDPEPLPAGHPLYSHPKVAISPHLSWNAPSSITRTLAGFGDNLARYRSGAPLEGLVDVALGY